MLLVLSCVFYLILLFVLGVTSATETAIHMARDVESQREEIGPGAVARKLRKIGSNPFAQLYRTLLLSATLNLALAALGLYIITGPLHEQGWHPWLSASTLFLATIALGDVIPKFLAARSPSGVLLGSLRALSPIRVILDPIANVADRTADIILKHITPQRVKMRLPITRDEFETLIEMREEQGLLDEAEAAVLKEVLAIEGLTVRDCMVPRVDLTLMNGAESEENVVKILEGCVGRFVLIYKHSPDVVEGVIDSIAWRINGRPSWQSVLRPPEFVPETMPILDALRDYLTDPTVPLLISDEYGGLDGLVSQEQIADWLLSEAAPWQGDALEIRELGNNRYLLDGATRLDHIESELQMDLVTGNSIDTVGGLVFNLLGHVPKAGERVKLEQGEIKVRRVVKARITQVELRLFENSKEAAV